MESARGTKKSVPGMALSRSICHLAGRSILLVRMILLLRSQSPIVFKMPERRY